MTRLNLLKVSNLIIGLGLALTLVMTVSALVDNQSQSNPRVDPILVSETKLTKFRVPPTAPPQTVEFTASPRSESPPSAPSALLPSFQLNPPIIPHLAMVTPTVSLPTATPSPPHIWMLDRMIIPAIQLDAPVVLATSENIAYQGQTYQQAVTPNMFAVGQLATSLWPGVVGNTVLIGHHNAYGEVFRHLIDLQAGDQIRLYSGGKVFVYTIDLKMILPEQYQPAEVRLDNAQWLAASEDERLTLITCWPYETNTHRLIIVARPANQTPAKSFPQ